MEKSSGWRCRANAVCWPVISAGSVCAWDGEAAFGCCYWVCFWKDFMGKKWTCWARLCQETKQNKLSAQHCTNPDLPENPKRGFNLTKLDCLSLESLFPSSIEIETITESCRWVDILELMNSSENPQYTKSGNFPIRMKFTGIVMRVEDRRTWGNHCNWHPWWREWESWGSLAWRLLGAQRVKLCDSESAMGKGTLRDPKCKIRLWLLAVKKQCLWLLGQREEHCVLHVLSCCTACELASLTCPLSNLLSTPVLDFRLPRNQKSTGKVIWQQMAAAKRSHLRWY